MSFEFEKESHTYRLNGAVLPSVTDVLAQLESFAGVPRETLEAARVFGQHVHVASALLVRDELDWPSLDEPLKPFMGGLQRFLNESGCIVLASETSVYSTRYRIAGTLDLLVLWAKREYVIDIKATATMPRTVGPQTAAYERLYNERFGGGKRGRACLLLKPNDYRLTPLTNSSDWSIFQSCLNVWRYKNAA